MDLTHTLERKQRLWQTGHRQMLHKRNGQSVSIKTEGDRPNRQELCCIFQMEDYPTKPYRWEDSENAH